MNVVMKATDRLRTEGDPRVIEAGPGSLRGADQLARALGWLSIGLGVTQLFGARRYARALGIEGQEKLVRVTGLREIGHGVLSLSTERPAGLWSRVGGDALDIGMLGAALRSSSRRGNVAGAIALVGAITLLDLAAAQAQTARRSRAQESDSAPRDYRDRSGFPRGLHASRGAALAQRRPSDSTASPFSTSDGGDRPKSGALPAEGTMPSV
jgi:hypothetical protein